MKSNAKNAAFMKFTNRQQILDIIRKGPVFRAEIARKTSLTRAAVSLIIDELVKAGIVIETGVGTSDYGRKPVLLAINPNSHYAIGLNISRSDCSAGIVNIKGELLKKRNIDIARAASADEALEIISNELESLITDSKIESADLLGIGVSTPGPLDVNSGVILNPPNFSMWHNIKITEELKGRLHFDTYLDDNSTALALAEKNYGEGSKYENFMLLVVDTGVGAGIVTNDNIYRSLKGIGSKVGHITVDINGERCDCGNIGCLELYTSIPALLKNIKKYDSKISSWKEIVDRAENGDKGCLDMIEREARYLSAGIVSVANILELNAVILSGYINYKPQMLLNYIRDIVNSSIMARNIHRLTILQSSIADAAEVVSSAAIVIDRFFSREW